MARPITSELEYFNTDVKLFGDRKIKRLARKFSSKGFTVYMYILCEIYGDKGYYMAWDNDVAFDISESLYSFDITEDLVQDIVNYGFEVGLFDKIMYNSYRILTSFGIQSRYIKAKRNPIIQPEFEIIESVMVVETRVSDAVTRVMSAETRVSDAITTTKQLKSTQRKEQENTVQERTEKKKPKPVSISNQNLSLILEDEKQVDEPEIKEKPQTPTQRASEFKKSLLENNVSKDLADEFMDIRKEKKARNSKTAFEGFMREVKKSEYSINEIVKRCCEKGWKGFEADWMGKEESQKTNNYSRPEFPHIITDKRLSRRPPRTNK